MSTLVALILGAGPNIGQSTANAFKAKGYGVALASRSVANGVSQDGNLLIQLDMAQPAGIKPVFEKVKSHFGTAPSVVIHNGAVRSVLSEDDPLSAVTAENVLQDLNVNTISALMAAKYAVEGFAQLPASCLKTFVYTGNKLNLMTRPQVLTFGMTKTAVAYLIPGLVAAYATKGYRFYYADERLANGDAAAMAINGPAHAEHYLQLATQGDQGPWHYTFVKGQGYQDFST